MRSLERLFVSPNTVKTHLTHIYGKLGVRGRSEAIRAAPALRLPDAPNDICPHLLVDADMAITGTGDARAPVGMTTGGVLSSHDVMVARRGRDRLTGAARRWM